MVNENEEMVVCLEIGDRTRGDSVIYPDDDLQTLFIDGAWNFRRKDGSSR